jgi:hypothetical protein
MDMDMDIGMIWTWGMMWTVIRTMTWTRTNRSAPFMQNKAHEANISFFRLTLFLVNFCKRIKVNGSECFLYVHRFTKGKNTKKIDFD